jgi:hypothetical protein
MSEIKAWSDSDSPFTKAELEKMLAFVLKRNESEAWCPYSREGKRFRLCKIQGGRCWWGDGYYDCLLFGHYWTESNQEPFEELCPVGG